MKSLKIIFILSLTLLLFGCASETEFSKMLEDERISILVHQEKVDNGIVIFYVPKLSGDEPAKASFEARFIRKTIFGWKETSDKGGTLGTLEKNLYGQYIPKYSSESPFPLLFGEITTPKIENIKVEYENGSKEVDAKTIKNNGKHFWFVFLEEPEVKTTYTIKGYSKNGELIETIEEKS